MNRKKLLKKLQHFFDRKKKEQENEIEKLQTILKKLNKKKRKLIKKIELEPDESSLNNLRLELEILNKQLEKGEKILNEILAGQEQEQGGC